MNNFFDNLYSNDKEDLLLEIGSKINQEKKAFIVTANPETFMTGLKDSIIAKILSDKNNYILADGIGIIKGCQKLNKQLPNKITGVDLMNDLLNIGNEKKAKVFLFGSKDNILKDLKQIINQKYPNIQIVGCFSGYQYNEKKIVSEINKNKPYLIFVALGIPKQEKFIERNYKKFNKGIFMGVGGSFDVLSGNKKRAPKIFRKLNIEWLYRIIKEPKRIKRFYQNNIKFIFKLK